MNKVSVASIMILLFLIGGAIFIPGFWPYDFAVQNVMNANKSFFAENPLGGFPFLLGTDHLGRDIFVRIWYGARVSFLVAAVVAMIDCAVGVIYGSISGYAGGMTDNIMMRMIEIINGIPYLIVVLLLMAVLPQGIGTLILAYSLVGWTSMARLVRGQVASLMNREYIIVAKTMGASMGRIILRHLLPNMMGVIIVQVTLDIPGIIFTEAFLSMLGMGVPQPYPSLGGMLNDGIAVFQVYPFRLIVPGVVICLTILSFNLLADHLREGFDPKRGRSFALWKKY